VKRSGTAGHTSPRPTKKQLPACLHSITLCAWSGTIGGISPRRCVGREGPRADSTFQGPRRR
jgi:hypothetical protein